MDIKDLVIVVLVSIATTLITVKCVKADDDYSNDFEYRLAEEYDNGFNESNVLDRYYHNPVRSNLHDVIRRQREDKLIKEIYRREKYTYRPLSPNKEQHRRMTRTDD